MNESDLSILPNDVVRTVLRETVEKLFKSQNYRINVNSASQTGENNFFGSVFRIYCDKENETQTNSYPTRLILKVAPQNEIQREQFFLRHLYLREIFIYNEVKFGYISSY